MCSAIFRLVQNILSHFLGRHEVERIEGLLLLPCRIFESFAVDTQIKNLFFLLMLELEHSYLKNNVLDINKSTI